MRINKWAKLVIPELQLLEFRKKFKERDYPYNQKVEQDEQRVRSNNSEPLSESVEAVTVKKPEIKKPEKLTDIQEEQIPVLGHKTDTYSQVEKTSDSQSLVYSASQEDGLANNDPYQLINVKESDTTSKEDLSEMIGLHSVKALIESLFTQVEMIQKRKEQGLSELSGQSLHLSFTGNPGMGKRTVAHIVAKKFNEIGVTSSQYLVETNHSNFVSEHIGESAIKTKEMIERARGGVLLIKEAYRLTNHSFGGEAIQAIVEAIVELEEELIVIVVGNERDMQTFWNSNSALRSSFTRQIRFPDYTVYEMVQIAKDMLHKKSYSLTQQAERLLEAQCAKEKNSLSSKNGQFVCNLVEATLRNHEARLTEVNNKIQEEDVALREDLL